MQNRSSPYKIRSPNSNSQPFIAAHLQGTQKPHHKTNLAKELQLPTHSNRPYSLKINSL